MRYPVFVVVLAALLTVAAACGDADPKDKNGSPGNVATNANTNNGGTTANNGGTTPNNGGTTANNGGTTANNATTNNSTPNGTTPSCDLPEPEVTPVDSCDEAGLVLCGWNGDCAEQERCQDIGNTPNAGVTCCVAACRGAKEVGELCTTVDECNSGSCIGRNDDPSICSKPCDTDVDCGGDLECVDIPFLAYPSWCVTPSTP